MRIKTLDAMTRGGTRCALPATLLRGLTVLFASLALVACVEDDLPGPDEPGSESTAAGEENGARGLEGMGQGRSALIDIPELNTFISEYLEIDQLAGGPGDANLFTGNDPADGTASEQLPAAPAGSTFIDWNDLEADIDNHRIFDETKIVDGQDQSSFPGSNECVGSSNVLSKMDLAYIAVANNNDYAYFATARSANNGDAGYMWLATRLPPDQRDGQSPCSAGETRLLYDISGPGGGSGGDVLLVGHFAPSGGPLIRVFQAKVSRADVPAPAAIDFTDSTLWGEITPPGLVAAVNTTATDPDALGDTGFKSMSGDDLAKELFAEAGIPLSVFTGGSSCGASYFMSIITRPSGSGGPNPDLKDLMMTKVNFGSPSASASLSPSCDGTFGYSLDSVTDFDGSPVDPNTVTCAWNFYDSNGLTIGNSNACSGSFDAGGSGLFGADVTVTLPGGNACSALADAGTVSVLEPITVSLTLDSGGGMCPGLTSDAATWSANVSGGDGNYSYTWSNAACTAGATSCTINPADSAFCFDDELYLTVDDGSALCPPVDSETETYDKVTVVTASDN